MVDRWRVDEKPCDVGENAAVVVAVPLVPSLCPAGDGAPPCGWEDGESIELIQGVSVAARVSLPCQLRTYEATRGREMDQKLP